jgi:hypothetical protein
MIKTARLKKFNRTWKYKPQRDIPLYNLSKRSVTDEQLNEFFDYALHWCQKKFGKIKGKSVPNIEWVWNDRWYQKKKLLALYDKEDNQIDLRIQGHRTIYNLANTIIHEYIHYLQPTHGNWYERYEKVWGYQNNPYEIEAHLLGDLYAAECANAVLQWMKPKGRGSRRGR